MLLISIDSNLHPYFLPEAWTLPLCPCFLLPKVTRLCSTDNHADPEFSIHPPKPALLPWVCSCLGEGHHHLPSYSGQVPESHPHFPAPSQAAEPNPEASFLSRASKMCIHFMYFFPPAPPPCLYNTPSLLEDWHSLLTWLSSSTPAVLKASLHKAPREFLKM